MWSTALELDLIMKNGEADVFSNATGYLLGCASV